jgi:hypothetical protein
MAWYRLDLEFSTIWFACGGSFSPFKWSWWLATLASPGAVARGFASFRFEAEMSVARGRARSFVGQGLLIRFISTLPAHRTAIIKAITRSPLIRGSVTAGW